MWLPNIFRLTSDVITDFKYIKHSSHADQELVIQRKAKAYRELLRSIEDAVNMPGKQIKRCFTKFYKANVDELRAVCRADIYEQMQEIKQYSEPFESEATDLARRHAMQPYMIELGHSKREREDDTEQRENMEMAYKSRLSADYEKLVSMVKDDLGYTGNR